MQVRIDHGLKEHTHTPYDDRGSVGKLFRSPPAPQTLQGYQVHIFIELTDGERRVLEQLKLFDTVIDRFIYDEEAGEHRELQIGPGTTVAEYLANPCIRHMNFAGEREAQQYISLLKETVLPRLKKLLARNVDPSTQTFQL